jgi:hypothetical protein
MSWDDKLFSGDAALDDADHSAQISVRNLSINSGPQKATMGVVKAKATAGLKFTGVVGTHDKGTCGVCLRKSTSTVATEEEE